MNFVYFVCEFYSHSSLVLHSQEITILFGWSAFPRSLKNLLPAFVGTPSGMENGRSFLLTAGKILRHGLKALTQTSSDTKRFARTVREADSSIGWREDEQTGISVAPFLVHKNSPKVTRQSGALQREHADLKTAPQIFWLASQDDN